MMRNTDRENKTSAILTDKTGENELSMKKTLSGIIAAALCVAVSLCALGEATPYHTETNGKIKETTWKDESGMITAGPEGYASVRYTYKGDDTIEQYYDENGKPYQVEGGYCGRRVQRDGKNRVNEIEYLDKNGLRTENALGYGQMTIAYTSFGEVRQVNYYSQAKKPVIVPSLGYASVTTDFSGKTITGRTYKDAKGNPVDCADGYAVMKQKMDKKKKNQVVSIRYDHADGSPATGPDGWFRCTKDRDDKGRLLSVKYYDVNMQLTDRGAGYAWEGYSYDGENIVKVTRYDLNGEPVADEAGVVTTVQEMKNGMVVKERFLDSNGSRISNSLGVAEILYSYDHQGSLESVSYRDITGNPVKCADGYAGYRDTKDEDGATASRVFLGTDGLAMEIPGGYSEVRYFYDETKQLSSTRYYDLNGKQIQAE